jgi:UDP-N-acetylmuramyl pentapeptide phosphotransferase/UDP-N-acetylglucosamine-1-phosphate transferase
MPKVLGQVAALGPLLLGTAWNEGPLAGVGLLLIALAALNLLNTFDNADGAAAGLAVLGFLLPGPGVAAATLGFLPFNLDSFRARNRPSGAPTAYLGDAGAFVLAFCVVCEPRSVGLLVLPALDLARLSLRRWRAGSRPWIGDRAHLAHRLAERGLARPSVAFVLILIAAPSALLIPQASASGDWARAGLGVLATASLFGVALALTARRGARN